MQRDAFELGEKIRTHTFDFSLMPELWNDFSIEEKIMKGLNWVEVKFLNGSGDDFSDEVKNLPNDKGGIYIFMIKSSVLPGTSEYLAYIGRAQLTENHSFRVRCKKYYREYLKDKERPKITTMINYFKDHLYLRYAVVDDNTTIVDLEAELINAILPPFNDLIPEKKVRDAVKAF
jgi:excinuclease UvrABC nuclease subunit